MTDMTESPAGQDGASITAKQKEQSDTEQKNTASGTKGQRKKTSKSQNSRGQKNSWTDLSPKDKLMKLAGTSELTHDKDGDAYITFRVNEHWEVWSVRSRAARDWLACLFFQIESSAPAVESMDVVIRQLEAQARYRGKLQSVHVRVAQHGEAVYIDLCDEEWRAIKITPKGWEVVTRSPVKFVRSRNMRPLPIPKQGGDLNELRPFLNIETECDFVLLVAYQLAALRPTGPYPIEILNGEQGSAKSVTSRLQRELCDPNAAPLRSLPREERDLAAAARNAHILCFDNISSVPAWLSDALCRIATGAGLGGRELRTDYDEAVFEAARPIILNGIPEDLAKRDDLADRSFIVTLPTIPSQDRKAEKQIWSGFEKVKPRILGVLLDVVSCALKHLPEVTEKAAAERWQLPRMADVALWVTAAEPALGWPEGTFLNAYRANRAEAASAIIEAWPAAGFEDTSLS